MALNYRDLEMIENLREVYDTRYWYILLRGLLYFKTGEYNKAYSFLLNGLKRIGSIKRATGGVQKSNRKYVVGLTKLESGRYESKAIFNQDYLSKHCPVCFFELLADTQQEDIVANLRLIMAICNKFLQKPVPSTTMLIDLLASLEERQGSFLTENTSELCNIVECIGFAVISDVSKNRYFKMKSRLPAHTVAKKSYGELCTVLLYTEDMAESLSYGMLYANYSDPSLVILMEMVAKIWDISPDHVRTIISKAIEDLVDYAFGKFSSCYEEESKNIMKLEVLQQIAFLGSFLEYKIRREKPTKFLHSMQDYTLLLDHTNQTDNNILSYNLGLFNEKEDAPLCASFSLNYSSWIQYFLKTQGAVSPAESLAALLISLNLNFDNQLCWNLLSRFMLRQDYIKFSLQALNMSKVFKIGQDKRESEYLIALWMQLLCKAEAANFKDDFAHESTIAQAKAVLRCSIY